MSLKCKNPIIIGGSGSSGSTLLATIINRHPDISIGPELSLFNKPALYNEPYHLFSKNLERYMVKGTSTQGWFLYWKTLRELKKYGWDKNELIKMSYKCKNNIEFIDNLFNRYLEENDSSIWAEKNPSNSYYFQSFLKLYPNGRIIHIYRDYRDVVSSLKKRGMNSYYASMLYLYNTSTALGCRKQENYYQLSYEELVTDPSRTINDLCKFLKVSYDKKILDRALEDLTLIAGQKPLVTKVRKSVANFKIRDGMPIGCKVTLRGDRMYDFLQRLLGIAIPRERDFRGLEIRSFDGRGNYSIGIKEHIIFPEIDYDKVDKIRGLDISISTSAEDDVSGEALLRAMKFPFKN